MEGSMALANIEPWLCTPVVFYTYVKGNNDISYIRIKNFYKKTKIIYEVGNYIYIIANEHRSPIILRLVSTTASFLPLHPSELNFGLPRG